MPRDACADLVLLRVMMVEAKSPPASVAANSPVGDARSPIHPGKAFDLALRGAALEQRQNRNQQIRLQDVHSLLPTMVRGDSNVSAPRGPWSGASTLDRVEKLGVATGRGIWVAARGNVHGQGAQ